MPTDPTLDQWKRLYELAAEIKKLAPWGWMQEDDLFAVQNPDTGDNGFVSVMGARGEHFAISIYLGTEALMGFWMMQESPEVGVEILLAFRQLQLSFDDREHVEDEDRAVMNELGLKFRGRNAWPIFRSFQPGFLPWLIDADEATFLIHALEQTLNVAPRFNENPDLLTMADDKAYFGRVVRHESGQQRWVDETIVVQPPQPPSIPLPMDEALLEAVATKPKQRKFTLELDAIGIEAIVVDEEGRPYFPTMLLGVDGKSGMVLISEILNPMGGPLTMLGTIPGTLIAKMAEWDRYPSTIDVRIEPLANFVGLLSEALGWKVRLKDDLKMLDLAAEALAGWMDAGSPSLPGMPDDEEMAPAGPRHRSGSASAAGVTRIIQFKISLAEIRPPIWRRVLVPDTMTLGDLHNVIQVAMGWWDSHMHEFEVNGVTYGSLDDESFYEVLDEWETPLSSLALREKQRIKYSYDFGDDWQHNVVVEKFLPVDASLNYPLCVAGKRACPPEDCGGPWGYAEFLETIGDPADSNHEEMLEWVGGEFDPEEFDLEETNEMLADRFGEEAS